MGVGSRTVRHRCLLGVVVLAAVWSPVVPRPAAAQITPQEFAIPSGSDARTITRGPDGNVWFTLPYANKLGRITPAGRVTEFSLPVPNSLPCGIAAGPDGNLWFTEAGRPVVGRITTAGAITEFPAPRPDRPPLTQMCDLVAGPDGNMWAGHHRDLTPGFVERIAPSGDVDIYPSIGAGFTGLPAQIVAGSDGALWVTQAYAARLGRVTTGGSISEIALPAGEYNDIAAGPDGNLWTVGVRQEDRVGRVLRVTPGGTISDFDIPGRPCRHCSATSLPVAVTSGPQGRLWFLDDARGRVGSITTDGRVAILDLPSSDRRLADITTGADGNLWFIQNGNHTIGRLSPSAVAAPTTTTGPPGTTGTTATTLTSRPSAPTSTGLAPVAIPAGQLPGPSTPAFGAPGGGAGGAGGAAVSTAPAASGPDLPPARGPTAVALADGPRRGPVGARHGVPAALAAVAMAGLAADVLLMLRLRAALT